jgi:hypothetical protein
MLCVCVINLKESLSAPYDKHQLVLYLCSRMCQAQVYAQWVLQEAARQTGVTAVEPHLWKQLFVSGDIICFNRASLGRLHRITASILFHRYCQAGYCGVAL